MKKIILLLTCGLAFCTGTAQTLPKWANQAKKAVFSVITYNKDNKILNTGNGFYIDEEGTAVSDYSLFKGHKRSALPERSHPPSFSRSDVLHASSQ